MLVQVQMLLLSYLLIITVSLELIIEIMDLKILENLVRKSQVAHVIVRELVEKLMMLSVRKKRMVIEVLKRKNRLVQPERNLLNSHGNVKIIKTRNQKQRLKP